MAERWRPIPDLEGYEASDLGNIRHRGRVLKLNWTGRGYALVLRTGHQAPSPFIVPRRRSTGTRVTASVPRLVALAWKERPLRETWFVGFYDGNPRNLRADNLFWETFSRHNKHWKRTPHDSNPRRQEEISFENSPPRPIAGG